MGSDSSAQSEQVRKALLGESQNLPVDKKMTSSMTQKQALIELISSPTGRNLFLAYLQKEFAIENLLFYEACNEFKKEFSSEAKTCSRLKEIVENFVKETAASQVNLSYGARSKILQALKNCENSGGEEKPVIDVSFFDDALKEILNLMTRDSFSRFRLTKEYKLFLAEINL
eukprot:TRINITY_DN16572_c0_g1_i1.p1 TRINITY_DN16572_c0_g1~~TRINITY_DN16572_c0_g1_i1.p1  ORF type:complete len:198 (+),score=57.78 TRINITY_DN16572_c0_g1_i1:81-596(+)